MTLVSRRANLLKEVLKSLDPVYDFRRAGEGIAGFPSYVEFEQFQKRTINSLTAAQLSTYELLMSAIKGSKMMDKECYAEFNGDGFFFNSEGKVVFYHDR